MQHCAEMDLRKMNKVYKIFNRASSICFSVKNISVKEVFNYKSSSLYNITTTLFHYITDSKIIITCQQEIKSTHFINIAPKELLPEFSQYYYFALHCFS